MKPIKYTPQKNRLIPVILLAGIFLLVATFCPHKADFAEYDVLSFCESMPEPVFSVPEGIYDHPFELEIQAPSGYAIYYTTDGSNPTVHSNKYKKSITIDPQENPNRAILFIPTSIWWKLPRGEQNHCIVIRARCFKNDMGYGKVVNAIYSTSNIRQHQGFQIVHILMDADDLFSQKRGIYVLGENFYSKKEVVRLIEKNKLDWRDIDRDELPANYHQRGKNWIRNAEFILTDLTGKTIFEQSVRLCIHGLGSRTYPEKSLRIMADSVRGNHMIQYRFFDNLPYESFYAILLRNSGTDFVYTMFCDALVQQMVKDIGLDIQEYAPAVVYINGNYWGIHNIREKMDQYYLAVKYDSSLENIHILDYDWDFELKFGNPLSLQAFEELVDYIRHHSMSDEMAYHHVCTQMDIDNFIDYIIVETFFANIDWGTNNMRPYKIDQQTEMMKKNNIEAGKWRWLLFDLDVSMSNWVPPSKNMFVDHLRQYEHLAISTMFFGLLKNPEFKEKFLNRYEYIIRNHLTTPFMLQHIEEFEERYQYEMERQKSRWRNSLNHSWRDRWWRIEQMKVFARERPEIVLEQLKSL